MFRSPIKFILLLLSGLLALSQAHAQTPAFPNKPIKLVIPFPAGTATDTVGRALAAAVSQAVGQTVVVENKAGADGSIAAAEVSRAPADGYTLLLATNSPMSAVPAMRNQPPYDPVNDFTAITDIGRYTFFVLLHPSVPANNLAELIQYAKANPGKINYATGNTTGILSIAQLASYAGMDMVHVPYKGEPQALTDLIAGRVQLMVAAAGVALPQVQAGKLKAIATTLPQRSPAMPNTPTIIESGVPKFSLMSWAALFGPPKMPADVTDRLNKEFIAAMSKPEVKAVMEKQVFALQGSTPAQLSQWVKAQLENYKGLVKAANIEMQ